MKEKYGKDSKVEFADYPSRVVWGDMKILENKVQDRLNSESSRGAGSTSTSNT